MTVVIQCAASKDKKAGFLRSSVQSSVNVKFVANPALAPRDESCIYARPDDPAEHGRRWRDILTEYNKDLSLENPFGLLPAGHLYANRAYADAMKQCGTPNVYVLSAGWGLIRSDFLTPQYDITFSKSAEPYKRRLRVDVYADFGQLPGGCEEPILFFGGKDYVSLFCQLTAATRGERVVFFNSALAPSAPGCTLVRYHTSTRTNWHYECVRDLIDGRLVLPSWT